MLTSESASDIASNQQSLTIGLIVSREIDSVVRACLTSLEEALLEAKNHLILNYEILVVESSAAPYNIRKLLQCYPQIRVISSITNNIASNRQIVLDNAEFENIFFTDPDCRVDKQIFIRLLQNLKFRDRYIGLAANVVNRGRLGLIDEYFNIVKKSKILSLGSQQIFEASSNREVHHSPTCGIMYFRDLLNGEKFNDEFSRVGEDLEFNFRLCKKTKKKFLVIADLNVIHLNEDSLIKFLRRCCGYGSAQLDIVLRTQRFYWNPRLIGGITFIPFVVLGVVIFKTTLLIGFFAMAVLFLVFLVKKYKYLVCQPFFIFAIGLAYSLGVYIAFWNGLRWVCKKSIFHRMSQN